ncbi:ATP cone domain-containing protein [Arenibacter sp. GZD96]|uniref:ATP cone domain-containing protein n=1 Tax=Aurantibrevibacter litoralis TaxID=3106030 RepID=UPI002AFF9C9D|nr:ATP cone domain-containing protein [Arenibacter sp. GZD-96]MEA1785192.1 ATP cone domain-containing protein [Arenibacter sp. GZD-96]
MKQLNMDILKSSGEKVPFSLEKLQNSLRQSGADIAVVDRIVAQVLEELYEGISTKEIYNRAFALLKKKQHVLASKYKLKKAIYELGPTGYPFERFVAALLHYSGYKTEVGKVVKGVCVSHEIDVFAEKENKIDVIECKFHAEEGRFCNVKVPLYISSRYQDVKGHWDKLKNQSKSLNRGWVVTNTRFTADATTFGTCCGLFLLSWDYPKNDGLKDRIDRLGLYPITVSTLLTRREKQFLLGRDIVLCRQLLKDRFFLDHLGISKTRKEKIHEEIKLLCAHQKKTNAQA